jgi:tRNA threonylcarbamoyl adenosine modification protein YeaZ
LLRLVYALEAINWQVWYDVSLSMWVLCIETSTPRGGWAFFYDGVLQWGGEMAVGPRHSQVLATQIAEAFDHLHLRPSELGLIGVGIGPGSYTGTRMGATLAMTLAYATGRPIAPVCSLLAWHEPGCAALVDARGGGVYGLKDGAPVMRLPVDELPRFLEGVERVITPESEPLFAKLPAEFPLTERGPDMQEFYRTALHTPAIKPSQLELIYQPIADFSSLRQTETAVYAE